MTIPSDYNRPGPHRDEYLRRAYKGPPDDACRIHIKMIQPYGPNVGEEMVRRVRELMLLQRKADADAVKAAGCICGMLKFEYWPDNGHHEACPHTLADKILEGGS